MIALAAPAVDLIFRRGSFNAADATATATYFAIFAISLALWTAQAIYARAFYAAGETFTPMLAGTIVTIVSIPIYWQLHQHFGVIGLAWASNLAILLQTGTLAVLAHRRHLVPLFGPPESPYAGLDRPEITRAIIAALVSLVGATLLLHLIPQPQTYRGDLTALLLGGLTWAVLAAATLHLTGSKLLAQLRSRVAWL
jgi:putative peptidoglycan lipid II flippase